ncbi:hypothetical protein D3C72_997570 [compost metagenome]
MPTVAPSSRQACLLSGLSLLLLVTSSGCAWFAKQSAKQPASLPDSAIAGFVPQVPGETTVTRMADHAWRQFDMTITERVQSVDRDADQGLHIRVEQEFRYPDLSKQTVTTGMVIYADRLEYITPTGGREIQLKTPLRPGTRWHFDRPDRQVTRKRIVAIEDVCTPRGTFPNALKVETTIATRQGGRERVVRRMTRWFAKGCGEVLTIDRPQGPDATAHERRYYVIDKLSADRREPFTPPPCRP